MNTGTRKILGIVIVVFILIVSMVIYINYVASHTEHIVPVYIGVDKREYGPNDTVTIYARLGTTLYPFEIYANYPWGITIFRIPDEIPPEEVLENRTLLDEISGNLYEGVVPFVLNNSKRIFEFQWNETVIGPPDTSQGPQIYKAMGGYYVVYPTTYNVKDGRNMPEFILTENSIFHLDGVYARLDNGSLIIDYIGEKKPFFTGEVYLDLRPVGITFNYTGSELKIPLNIQSQGYLSIKTSLGTYGVGYYNGNGESSEY